jgi:hypothetical protein
MLPKNGLSDLVITLELHPALVFVTGTLDLVKSAVGEIDDVGSALPLQPAQIAQENVAEVLFPHTLRQRHFGCALAPGFPVRYGTRALGTDLQQAVLEIRAKKDGVARVSIPVGLLDRIVGRHPYFSLGCIVACSRAGIVRMALDHAVGRRPEIETRRQ